MMIKQRTLNTLKQYTAILLYCPMVENNFQHLCEVFFKTLTTLNWKTEMQIILSQQ